MLHIQTNKVIKQRNSETIPIKMIIIKQVHALATLDKIVQELRIKDRAKNVVFDSAWISRVDYDEEDFDNDEYDKKA